MKFMKKIMGVIFAISLLTSIAVSVGCARQPSDKTAIRTMERFFKKYAKKYPESAIGKYPVQSVVLLHLEEVHKNMVAAYAILELENGMGLQTRFTFIKKPPLGWRALSWENMGMAQRRE